MTGRRWQDPRHQLLALSNRVRLHYHSYTSRGLLPRVREWATRSECAVDPEWDECLSARGRLSAWLLSIDDPETWVGSSAIGTLLAKAPFPTLHAVGYWYSSQECWLPDPSRAARPLDPRAKKAVLKYLAHGATWTSNLGFSWCRVCDLHGLEMGCSDLSDSVWIWPEGLGHYVEKHYIALPDAFLAQIASGVRMVKRDLEMARDIAFASDERWICWAAQLGALRRPWADPLPEGWIVTSHETLARTVTSRFGRCSARVRSSPTIGCGSRASGANGRLERCPGSCRATVSMY